MRFFVFLCSLSMVGSAFAQLNTVTINQMQNMSTTHVPRGAIVNLSLQANPSTGYSWKLVSYDSYILRSMGQPRFVSYANGVPGAMGSQIFSFRAQNYGGTSIQLVYSGPGRGVPPAQTFTCIIDVDGPSNETVTIGEWSNNSTVRLNVGDTLIVRLSANPSTGYGWNIGPMPSGILQQIGRPKFVSGNSGRMGAGGTTIYTFRVVGGGGFFLRFAYSSSSQGGLPPEKTFEVFIQATQGNQHLLGSGF